MRLVLLLPLWLSGCLVPDAMVDHLLDADQDGERTTVVGGTDCDDHDPKVRAHGVEVCGNVVDDDCDGVTDDRGRGEVGFYADRDGDGFGDPHVLVHACALGEELAAEAGDCDDADRTVHPGLDEDCGNGIDDDCDGAVDETDDETRWWPDFDGDGWGTDAAEPIVSCVPVPGWVAVPGDCDDHDAHAFPTAHDPPYDGVDSACDGDLLEFDVDRDGSPVDPALADPPVTDPTYVPWGPTDCDDRDPDRHPGLDEVWYDGVDANCDGADDDDQDGDGHADAGHGGDDCNDQDPDRHPGHPDVCDDGLDEDCDPNDENDCDGDGHVDEVAGGDDCDDGDADVWALCATCDDRDHDGRWSGCDAYAVHEGPDCNDLDAQVWSSCATCGDGDGDGRLAGCDAYLYVQADCDDADPRAWTRCASCADHDHDGFWALCDTPDEDCDDTLENAWSVCEACVDEDGDGVGVGDCEGPGPVDCDDTDPDVDVSCGLCVDLDGDGSRAGCDQHLRTPHDCDDTDPEVGGHVFEILDDGVDQDCNGRDLTVSERDGVFVTPTGADDRGCGTRAEPCATIGYAAGAAREAGKVVFVAEGTYPAFETWVSVVGGFDARTWVEAGLTSIDLGTSGSIFVDGPATELRRIDVTRAPGIEGRAGVDIHAGFVHLVEVSASLPARSVCEFVAAEVELLAVDDSVLTGCGGTEQNVGIGVRGTSRTRLLVSNTRVELLPALYDARNTGIGVADGVSAAISASEVVVGGSADATGIGLGARARLDATDVRVAVGTTTSPSSRGVWGAPATARLRSTVVEVAGYEALGLDVLLEDGAELTLEGSVVLAESPVASRAVVASGTGPTRLTGATLLARAPSSIALSASGPASLVGTVLASDDRAMTFQGSVDVSRSVFDAPCLVDLWQETCSSSGAATPASCPFEDCRVTALVWTTDTLDPTSPWGATPRPGSPALDAWTDTAGVPWRRDVIGQPRSTGAWDVGAVEVP